MQNLIVERVALSGDVIKTIQYDMAARLAETTENARKARAQKADILQRALSPLISIVERDKEAAMALRELTEAQESRQLIYPLNSTLSRLNADFVRAAPLSASVNPGGLTVIGPPFDVPWTDSRGNLHGTRSADTSSGAFAFNTGPITGDFSSQSAGIGVIVTTPISVAAHVTADAIFDFAWADSASFATSHTNGFIGILIYETDGTGSARVVSDVRKQLWADGTAWLEEHNDSGSGFFQNDLYQIGFTMNPGHRYLIWTWCGGVSDGNLASCRLDAQLYLLSLWAFRT